MHDVTLSVMVIGRGVPECCSMSNVKMLPEGVSLSESGIILKPADKVECKASISCCITNNKERDLLHNYAADLALRGLAPRPT